MDVDLDAPGYGIQPSEGSSQGRNFIVGNGQRVPNEGEAVLNLEARGPDGTSSVPFSSTFQSAKITRPLMSVSKICRNKHTCTFTDQHALISDSSVAEVYTLLTCG